LELADRFNVAENLVRQILVDMHNDDLIELGSCIKNIFDIVPYDQLGMTVDEFFDSLELRPSMQIKIPA
jgi:hypothetical protein